MRPGRIRPGRPRAVLVSRIEPQGFNEAGANPPRKTPRGRFLLELPLGFNEAGANPPRKTWSGVRLFLSPAGFNEAGANPPRKTWLTYYDTADNDVLQ